MGCRIADGIRSCAEWKQGTFIRDEVAAEPMRTLLLLVGTSTDYSFPSADK